MTQATDNLVRQRTENGITTVTLSHPERRNNLSMAMLEALSDVFTAIEQDSETRVVVLAAEGHVFCAGHDLREMRSQFYSHEFQLALFQQCSKVMQQVVNLPQPVIGRITDDSLLLDCRCVEQPAALRAQWEAGV